MEFSLLAILLLLLSIQLIRSEPTIASLKTETTLGDELDIQCLFHGIKLRLSNNTASRINENSSLLIRQNLDAVFSPVCYVPSESLQLFIPFPFRLCDTKLRLHGNKVTFYNTVWISEGTETNKYADFSCTYHKSVALSQDIKKIKVESLSFTDNHENVTVDLCRSPFFCPRECEANYKIQNEAIYFARYVFHLSLRVRSSIEESNDELVIAIDNLQLRCGSIENSSLTYDSVIDGCQAQNWKNYLSEWSNTVATSIDYNVAALTICMSVDTPPPKLCPKFFVVGSLIYCKKSSAKMCDDISGMRCEAESQQSKFSVGPLYVFPSSKGQSMIRYYISSVITTAAIITTNPITLAAVEYDRSETMATSSIIETTSKPNYKDVKFVKPDSKERKKKIRKSKKEANVIKTKLNLEDPTTPEPVATEKTTKPKKIDVRNHSVTFSIRKQMNNDSISSSANTENIEGKEEKVIEMNEYPENQLKVPVGNEVAVPELDENPELNRKLADSPIPKASLDQEDAFLLGKYKTVDGNKIFMWSLIGSLGVFLFLSISLLVTWMYIRSKSITGRRRT